ncbi:hypothetical protein B0O80DRAFT_149618 [Mortierella sp. GBAus27b]|nr:hypothetical protein B0O80DRAFT_149618 [Mortierella sp. GBAus27b]
MAAPPRMLLRDVTQSIERWACLEEGNTDGSSKDSGIGSEGLERASSALAVGRSSNWGSGGGGGSGVGTVGGESVVASAGDSSARGASARSASAGSASTRSASTRSASARVGSRTSLGLQGTLTIDNKVGRESTVGVGIGVDGVVSAALQAGGEGDSGLIVLDAVQLANEGDGNELLELWVRLASNVQGDIKILVVLGIAGL